MKRLIDPAWTAKTPARQFLTALALSIIAISLRWAVSPWLGEHHEFLPGYAAVAAATWLGTWRAGLVVAAVSLVALQSPLFHPIDVQRLPAHLQQAASVIAFVFVAGLLTYLTHHASKRLLALRDEVTRLDDADHKKSDFLALIAHELRNPLSAISVGGRLIKSGRLDKRAMQGTWDMMERQTDHMKRLIADLLDVARIEQGKIELRRERTSVRSLVEQAIKDAAPYTESKQQAIALEVEGDPGEAYVDALRIGQVLGNLLHNASKFSPEGAPIDITVQATAHSVLIAVRDRGIGIPASELHAIFESFVQLEPRSGRPQGLGLGLALCSKLLQMHEGTIEARSDGVGSGAEFVVRFPRALGAEPIVTIGDEPQQFENTQPLSQPGSDTPLRLLVVDDNRDAAESLALLLRMMGHMASTAPDGRSALLRARQEQPDFVFLDIGLPDMTGHEVALRLRQQIEVKQPVLVALTGWGSDDDVKRSKRNGFDAHLTKPVSLEQIEQALAIKQDPLRTRATVDHAACRCVV